MGFEWIALVLIPVAVFLYIRLFKRRSLFCSLLLSLFFLLALLFLFDIVIEIPYRVKSRSPVLLLIDHSRSVIEKEPNLLQNPLWNESFEKILYFSDTASPQTNRLRSEKTALYDVLQFVQNQSDAKTRIVMVSDFNDNDSLTEQSVLSNIYPIVVTEDSTLSDTVSLYSVESQEFFITGESLDLTVVINSRLETQALLTIRESNNTIYQSRHSLKTGQNKIVVKLALSFSGYRVLKLSVANDADRYLKNNTVERLVLGISDRYKILLVGGKPSTEFACLRRLLERLRWVSLEVRLLKYKGETIEFADLKPYSALILMDIRDYQIKNSTYLKTAIQSGLSTLYVTGLARASDIKGLLGLFTNWTPEDSLRERRFVFEQNELVVMTSFDVKELLLDIIPTFRVFFGFDTWRWDFIRSYDDISFNHFESFWQGQIQNLLKSQSQNRHPDKLNYIIGDSTPVPKSESGLYPYSFAGQMAYFLLQHNPKESSDTHTDYEVASRYQRDYTTYPSLSNQETISDYLERVRGLEEWIETQTFVLRFRNNPFNLILMLLVLTIFWIRWDYEGIKG